MPLQFTLGRAEVTVRVTLSEPAFRVFQPDASVFLASLWPRLQPLGLDLQSCVGDFAGSDFNRVRLTLNMFSYAMSIRFQLTAFDFWANLLTVGEERFKNVLLQTTGGVRDVEGIPQFLTYATRYQAHGYLQDGERRVGSAEFIAGLTRPAPEDLGPSVGSGVAYFFGPTEDRLASMVNVDLSAAVADALFFRVDLTHDATAISAEDSAARAQDYVRTAYRLFGLDPVTG